MTVLHLIEDVYSMIQTHFSVYTWLHVLKTRSILGYLIISISRFWVCLVASNNGRKVLPACIHMLNIMKGEFQDFDVLVHQMIRLKNIKTGGSNHRQILFGDLLNSEQNFAVFSQEILVHIIYGSRLFS